MRAIVQTRIRAHAQGRGLFPTHHRNDALSFPKARPDDDTGGQYELKSRTRSAIWPRAVQFLLAKGRASVPSTHLRNLAKSAYAESSSSFADMCCVGSPVFHVNAAIADWTTARSTCSVIAFPARSCKKRSGTSSLCGPALHTGKPCNMSASRPNRSRSSSPGMCNHNIALVPSCGARQF